MKKKNNMAACPLCCGDGVQREDVMNAITESYDKVIRQERDAELLTEINGIAYQYEILKKNYSLEFLSGMYRGLAHARDMLTTALNQPAQEGGKG